MTNGMFGDQFQIGDVLEEAEVGLWNIEIVEGEAPRMYADQAMLKLLGLKEIPTPEACYAYWYGRIEPEYLEQVERGVAEIASGRHSEVSYEWNHPSKGKSFVRCGGTADKSYHKGLRMRGYHQDVTELRMLKQEREQLRSVNKTMLASLKDLYLTVVMLELEKDRIHPLCLCRDNREIVTSINSGEAILQKLSELYHPEDQERYQREISTANFSELAEHGERRFIREYRRRIGGAYRWVSITCYFPQSGAGSRQLMIAVQDIHEQKRQEKEYQEYLKNRSEGNMELLRMSLKNTDIFEFFYYPKEDRIVLPKEAAEQYHCKCEYSHMKESFATSFVDPGCYEDFCRMYDRIRDGAKNDSLSYSSGNGRYWCRASITSILFDKEGKTELAVGILEDMTRQKKIEQENQKYQSIYKFTVDNEYEEIVILDLAAQKAEAKTAREAAWKQEEEAYFWEDQDGSFMQKMAPEDQVRYLQEVTREQVRKRLGQGEETVCFYYQGTEQPRGHRKQLTIRYFNQERTMLFACVRDIERQMRAEEKNKEALSEAYESAKQANKAKSEFLAKMSHDIRTPMNAIMGMTAIAEMNLQDNDRVRECLDKIKIASQHLLRLINEVLDMSRIESGKLDLSVEGLELSEVLKSVVAMVQAETVQKHQKLETELKPLAHPRVIGDYLHLQKICSNILGNAVKYTQEGGTIRVSLEELPSIHPEYGCFRIVFQDNGYGMSEEFQKRLFLPFERSDDPRIAAVGGTGLGMAITYNIIKRMQGEIKVESELDQGSVFTVILHLKIQEEPAENKKEEGGGLAQVRKASFGGKRALLAEDNELNVEIAVEILEMCGLEVTVAQNGAEAADRYLERPEGYYDIVFMDIQMPVMDGYTAARLIRDSGRRDAASLPIVAMTANAFLEDVQKARQFGMNDHVSKPIDLSYLIEVMTKWLS